MCIVFDIVEDFHLPHTAVGIEGSLCNFWADDSTVVNSKVCEKAFGSLVHPSSLSFSINYSHVGLNCYYAHIVLILKKELKKTCITPTGICLSSLFILAAASSLPCFMTWLVWIRVATIDSTTLNFHTLLLHDIFFFPYNMYSIILHKPEYGGN